jgi:hypothetical protein
MRQTKSSTSSTSTPLSQIFHPPSSPSSLLHNLNTVHVTDQHKYLGADASAGMGDFDEADYNEDQATLKATDLAAAIRDTVEYPLTVARPPEEPMDDEFDFTAMHGPLTDRSRSRGGTIGRRSLRNAIVPVPPSHQSVPRQRPANVPVPPSHQSVPRQRPGDFDSPASSSNRADSSWSDGADSRKRHSETSATSFTSIQTPDDCSSPVSNRFGGYVEHEDEMSHGFEDPGPSLRKNAKSKLTRILHDRRDVGIPPPSARLRDRKKAFGREVMIGENDLMDDGVIFTGSLRRRPLGQPEQRRGVRPKKPVPAGNEVKELRVKGGTIGRSTVLHLPETINRAGGARSLSASTVQTPNKSSSMRPRASQSGTDRIDLQAPFATMKSKPESVLTTPNRPRKQVSIRDLFNPAEGGGTLRRRQSASDLISKLPEPDRSPRSPRNENSAYLQHRPDISRLERQTVASWAKRKDQRGGIPSFDESQRKRESDMADTSSISSVSTGASAQPDVLDFRYGHGARTALVKGNSPNGKGSIRGKAQTLSRSHPPVRLHDADSEGFRKDVPSDKASGQAIQVLSPASSNNKSEWV